MSDSAPGVPPPLQASADPNDEETQTMSQPAAAPYADSDWSDDLDELPVRPRRRWLTPFNVGLLAVLVAACGFLAGVLVQKGQSTAASNATGGGAAALRRALGGAGASASGTASGAGAAGAGAAGASRNATVGVVSTVDGHSLYLNDAQGNTVKVHVASGARVSKTISTDVASIHPGDTVIAQGATGSDGTVTANVIRATAANVASGGGLGSLFGGGSPFAGAGGTSTRGGRAGGATGAGGGGGNAGGGGQALFGPSGG